MKHAVTIDPISFEKQFQLFVVFVGSSGPTLRTFGSHPYLRDEEGYKEEVWSKASKLLSGKAWASNGKLPGELSASIVDTLNLKRNNLVDWSYKEWLKQQLENTEFVVSFEDLIRKLFSGYSDEEVFIELSSLLERKYALPAFLFFLKDKTTYMPIATRTFDSAFRKLGVDFQTSRRCSWDNYQTYLRLLGDVQMRLSYKLDGEVSLLDAHSFCYILAKQMEKQKANVQHPTIFDDSLLHEFPTHRDAIVKLRLGQGLFRQSVVAHWGSCAVTGCTEVSILTASHIKPWAHSNNVEKTDPFNGILLSPNLDSLFDAGLITFDNLGGIIISRELSSSDLQALAISKDMGIRSGFKPQHLIYLQYHRSHIYKDNREVRVDT